MINGIRFSINALLVALIVNTIFVTGLFAETIVLKSGKTMEANIIEQKDRYLKVDYMGMTLTVFLDEIASIGGQDPGSYNINKPVSKTDIPVSSSRKTWLEDILAGDFEKGRRRLKIVSQDNSRDFFLVNYVKILDDYDAKKINKDFVDLVLNGEKYLMDNQYEAAIEKFDQALQINPTYPLSYQCFIRTYVKLGQYDKVEYYAQKLSSLNLDNPQVYMGFGLNYLYMGRFEQARENFLKAKELFEKKSIKPAAELEKYLNMASKDMIK